MNRRWSLMLALLLTAFASSAWAQTADQKAASSSVLTPAGEPIGNVATITGTASLIRFGTTNALKSADDIYMGDTLQTGPNSALNVTFNDDTTFNLSANAKIVVDKYVYDEGGKNNSAVFNVARGTVAFVANAVAKTGDMKISTPTATLGIRGTTGVIDVPDDAATAANRDVNIKLYPDADGRVGHIDVNGRDGVRLGSLTRGASGFAIRAGGGGRFLAAPLTISPQQIARDQGFVRQVHAAQITGRQIVTRQRDIRRQNPSRPQPNMQRPNGAPPPGQKSGPNNRTEQKPSQQRQGNPQRAQQQGQQQNATTSTPAARTPTVAGSPRARGATQQPPRANAMPRPARQAPAPRRAPAGSKSSRERQ